MRGNLRRKNRSQAQTEILFKQNEFSGGWSNDLSAIDLPKDTMALLDNFNAFPEYLEGRSGSQKFSATSLPGSGTIYGLKQHPTTKQFILARGLSIYRSDSTMSSWTAFSYHANIGSETVTISGDAAGQLSALFMNGVSTSNTNAGTMYWNLTNSGSTRTFNVYKNSGKTQLVATATRSGDGYANIIQQNNSGIGGNLSIAFTINDSDAGNLLTAATEVSVINEPTTGVTLKVFNNDAVLFSASGIFYLDLANAKLIAINGPSISGFGSFKITGSGSQAAATPYGYRYVYTLSRIESSSGVVDYTKNRISATLLFEGPSNDINVNGGTNTTTDYGEFWLANPISSGNANTFNSTVGAVLTNSPFGFGANPHYTHLSLYRTLDIGVSGTDPISGGGNNGAVFIWVGDYDITQQTISDTKTDAELRAALNAGFGLRTHFWRNIPSSEVGEITPTFLYAGVRGANQINYGQLAYKQYIGFYNPAYQFFKLDDGIQVIAKSPDMVTFICSNKTYISSPNSFTDEGSAAIGSVYVLTHLTIVSDNIGCTDYGSFAPVDAGTQMSVYGASAYSSYIAHCSDHSVRIWNHSSWSDDLSSRKVNLIIRQMVNGSVGLYCRGVYYLWYRTDSSQTNNNLCLRLGMGRDTGIGWSKVSGSAWVVPPLNSGATVFIDTNIVQRMMALDAVDGFFYWIETFASYTGSSLSKYFKDKVATDGTGGTAITCKARFREITSSEEDDTLFHKESHLFDRPYDESVGYATGLQRNLLVYVDGSQTAADTLTNVPNKADLQFFNTITGRRIQLEAQYTTSQVRLTGFNARLDAQDKMNFGAGPQQYPDATNQANLAQNMTIWLCRPYPLLNRATGTSFTLTGTAPTAVTGPDTKTYALSFPSGASYSIASTTSYTDFAVHFWVKTVTTSKKIFQMTGTNSFYVQFTAVTTLDINGAGNVTVSTIAIGFHSFWIVRSGTTVSVYQNGVLNGTTVTVATARGGTTFDINPSGGAMILDDIRAYTTAPVAADITYYYSDVTSASFTGNKVLPLA